MINYIITWKGHKQAVAKKDLQKFRATVSCKAST